LSGLKTMKSRKKIVAWFVVVFFLSVSCASPVNSFDIGEEREVGEKLLYSIRSSFSLIDDPDITQYISALGSSVLEVAGIQYFDYHFFIVDNKDFNAFAAPSGLIFFHSGLIEAVNSEDELVSVLAHEIGHIVKRHLASRIEKGKYSSMASLGLALAAVAFGGAATPALLTGALATGQSMNLHFSRQHEEEADLLAYEWMKTLNRSPEGQIRMLESMRRIARYRSDKLPQYLLTHPNPEARLHTIESFLDIDRTVVDVALDSTDEIDFLRFKYRILSQVKDAVSLRAYFSRKISESRATEQSILMAKYGLSQVAMIANDYEKSLHLLDEVIARYPEKSIFLTDKGVALAAAGQLRKAERILRQALSKNSSDMYASFSLAKVLEATGHSSKAEVLLKEVMYQLPEYSRIYYELGHLASGEGKAGVSNYYLGKYNLFEGKLQLAVYSFKAAGRDKNLPEEMKKDIKLQLAKIKRLKK
jgi:predicted Zn-dependent protease